jgi:predicted ABC-type ATPase
MKLISPSLIHSYLTDGGYSAAQIRQFQKEADDLYREMTWGKHPRPHPLQAEVLLVGGPPGAGKTRHVNDCLATRASSAYTLNIDPDEIRGRLPFFQEAISEQRSMGLSFEAADQIVMQTFNAAAISITQSLVNRAQEDGYNIIRQGKLHGPVTRDLCQNIKGSGYEMAAAIFLAPLQVCQDSITHRQQSGGHPIDPNFFRSSYATLPDALTALRPHCREITVFWRAGLHSPPHPVLRLTPDGDDIVYFPEAAPAVQNLLGIPLTPQPQTRHRGRHAQPKR